MKYFYQKSYRRSDGETYVKRYSRSFPLGKEVDKSPDSHGSNVRESSVSRARSKVRLIAFCNPQLTGLLTLTNADCPTEAVANARFDAYRRRVAKIYPNWQFLGVKELQKRGSIHWHLLVNFCPAQVHRPLWDNPNQQQSDLWPYISDFQWIQGDDGWRTELYLLKYITKESSKLFRSYYVRSRNLQSIEPRYFDTQEPIHPLAENVYRTHIENKSDSMLAGFEILEYTYNIKLNRGEHNAYQPTITNRGQREN